MGDLIDLEEARESRRPGWRVARRVMCLDCGNEWVGVLPPSGRPVKLGCRRCGRHAGIVMEWDTGDV
jgi:hypothetical protein